MPDDKDVARFVKETAKYTKSVSDLSRTRDSNADSLEPDVVHGLLNLVKEINHLLLGTPPKKEPVNRGAIPRDAGGVKKKEPIDPSTEFDIGRNPPMNFNTPLLPLTVKNCPGLTEVRSDYKPVPAPSKKKK